MPQDTKIIGPQQIETVAEMVSDMLGTPDPCAGVDYSSLLSAYYEDPDARVKINAIVSASKRIRNYRRR